MGFTSFCQQDPLAKFIRTTYQAIPLSLPDPRFKPLSIVASDGTHIKYLGTLDDESYSTQWLAPRQNKNEISDISKVLSSELKINLGLKLIQPFLTAFIPTLDIGSTFHGQGEGNHKLKISINKVARDYITPMACAKAFQDVKLSLPSLNFSSKECKILLVDSIYTSKEFTLIIEGANSGDITAKLESKIAGNAKSELVYSKENKLVVSGEVPATFAFTCVELLMDGQSNVTGIKIPLDSTRANAVPINSFSLDHVDIGEATQLVFIDE
ncbi:hypothetical protein [Pedobacter aquatilis]|uniref:hypothetical protein n=1 Tax=Pedobacter aquatilis TaxID=351343 RepID=UPI00292EC58A|nr:hypothetical protein [Pedobacter aquatilis]